LRRNFDKVIACKGELSDHMLEQSADYVLASTTQIAQAALVCADSERQLKPTIRLPRYASLHSL